MDFSSLATTLAKAGAPILGGAIGGPAGSALAGVIIGALADALGTDATPAAVEAAVRNDPEAPAKVAAVEAAKAPAVMDEINARLADVQDARAMQISAVSAGSNIMWSPTIVSAVVLAGFCLVSYLAFHAKGGTAERDIVLFLLGAWLSLATSVVSFWLGSSSSSKGKDESIAQLTRAAPPAVTKGKR